jgi:hypothetical protein
MSERKGQASMQFPTKSHRSTDEMFSWDEVKAIMDKEIMRRVEYVTTIVQTMRDRFGEEALDIAADAIYQIGYKKGKARSEFVQQQGQENDLESLSKLIAHKMSRLYLGTTIDIKQDELTVKETYCPLPIYWNSIGLSDNEVIQFCRIFDQVDKGMVEGYNCEFTTDLSGAEELSQKGYCQMVVRRK